MALLALLAILVGVSATTLTADGPSGGALRKVDPSTRASLRVVSIKPVAVTGRAFKPGELVRLSAAGKRKSVTAGPRGGFKAVFPGVNACNGFVVVARGSEGSRATVTFAQFSNVHCLEPGVKSVGATQSPADRRFGS